MKAEYGKLDVSKKYSLVDIDYKGEWEYERCENCDNIIRNVAIVEDEGKNMYRIGLDCMMTLTNMEPDEQKEAKKILNRTKKFVKFLKNDCKCILVKGDVCYLYKYIPEKPSWHNAAYRAMREYTEDMLKKIKTENEIKIIYDTQ